MPVPISRLRDMPEENGKSEKSNFSMDYSFLTAIPQQKRVEASNQDADTIMKIWSTGDFVSEDTYKVASDAISQNDIKRLSSKGFVTCSGDTVKFTSKGKLIITTMTLGESNNFLKDKKQISYREIMASLDKRGKKGYRVPKFASTLDISNNE